MKIILSFCLLFLSCDFCWSSDLIRVCFSPRGGCQEEIIKQINRSDESIDIAMFDLTSRNISQALLKAKKRNVKIRIVLDRSQSLQRSSQGRVLKGYGFDIFLYKGSGIMHNKFAIIDSKVLLTGSYNWTLSAQERNEENLLVIKEKDLIRRYEQRFDHLLDKSEKKYIQSKDPSLRRSSRVSFF